MRRRVVVTGVGLVSPLGGRHRRRPGRASLAGRPASARSRCSTPRGYSTRFAGEVKGFDPLDWIDKKDVKKCGRFIQFAIAATAMAMEAAACGSTRTTPTRVGVVIGSGIGGFEVIEREHRILLERGPDRVSPFFILSSIVNLAAGQVSVRLGAKGPNSAVATACTTGAHADRRRLPADPGRLRRRDDLRRHRGQHHAARRRRLRGHARALDAQRRSRARASRPWDADRDGFVVGEGAGILVLEELGSRRRPRRADPRRARRLRHERRRPPPDGAAGRRRRRRPRDGGGARGCGPGAGDIQYLNAHATSTPLGDKAEATRHRPGLRRARAAPRGQLDQVDDRPPARRRRRARSRPHGPRAARSDRAADDQSRSSRMQTSASILVPHQARPLDDGARDDELVRLRRHQRLADFQARRESDFRRTSTKNRWLRRRQPHDLFGRQPPAKSFYRRARR